MRARRGQALVEFALVFPILLLLIAGIMEFGRAWQIKQVLTSVAANAARQASLGDSTVAYTTTVEHEIRVRVKAAGLDTSATNFDLSGDSLQLVTGTPDTVMLKYRYRMKMMGAFLHWTTGTDTVTLQARTVMRNE